MNEYDQQAANFLTDTGLTFAIRPDNSQRAPWTPSGRGYRVTLSRANGLQVSFPFWGSIHDKEHDRTPGAYDVLACLSGEASAPTDPAAVCAEFDMDAANPREWRQAERIAAFAATLQTFFTPAELDALAEIQ